MPAYKIYKSGSNYEIYEYEHVSASDDVLSAGYEGVLDNMDVEPKDEYEKQYDSEQRRKRTLRENAMALKRMAREHFDDDAFFITLTYSDKWACDASQIDKSDRRTKSLWKKIREHDPDLRYIGVRELQKKRGVIHYHYIVQSEYLKVLYAASGAGIKNKGKYQIKNDEHKFFENTFEKMFWKFGWADLRPVKGEVDDTGAYLAKYMTKAKLADMAWLENRRLILRSENVKKIEPLCPDNDSEEILALIQTLDMYKSIAQDDIQNNAERKRVFTNGYKTEFTGQVMYYDIHLNRIQKQ